VWQKHFAILTSGFELTDRKHYSMSGWNCLQYFYYQEMRPYSPRRQLIHVNGDRIYTINKMTLLTFLTSWRSRGKPRRVAVFDPVKLARRSTGEGALTCRTQNFRDLIDWIMLSFIHALSSSLVSVCTSNNRFTRFYPHMRCPFCPTELLFTQHLFTCPNYPFMQSLPSCRLLVNQFRSSEWSPLIAIIFLCLQQWIRGSHFFQEKLYDMECSFLSSA
jgi:hypothetical protein